MGRIDKLIADCSDWGQFWATLTNQPPATQGSAFERVTQLYLLSHPEYRTQLKHVWRVRDEVPPRVRGRINLPQTDEGIDLIAETHDGKFWAIQCKFRSNSKKPLTYGELSTFTSLAFVTCKEISLAVVAHTCCKPVRKHRYLGNATEIGLDRWLGLTNEDWLAIKEQIAGRVTTLTPLSPRPHQQKAIEAAQAHFGTARRGRMIMPCASGKSLTAFWIAQALNAQATLVAVPSLALIQKSLLDWTREHLAHGEVPQWLIVCGDESTGAIEKDEFVGSTYDLGVPTTTNREEIAAFLRKRKGRRVVFTTYQSSVVLADAARASGTRFDLAILDEAHRTVGVKGKAFSTLLSDENLSVQWRLFMTATERVLRGANDDVFSMDDESVYGKLFYQLTFKDAIAHGIICDYRILTITVSDAAIQDFIAEKRLMDMGSDQTDAQSLAAAVALRRAVESHGVMHAISFHRSIASANAFSARQSLLDDAVQPRLASLHVSSKMTVGERATLMRQFVGEERALLTNARCLTEGVDVPAIDCVLFAEPKQSVVDIVQAAGRALRPCPGKTYGYILLPLVVPEGMNVEEFADSTEFKQVARTITALSTQDERIAEQFRVMERPEKTVGRIVEFECHTPVGTRLDIEQFSAEIGTRIWERVGRANWRPFDKAREFVQSLKLQSEAEWRAYRKSGQRPPDIPSNPHAIYERRGWSSVGDWLGTGVVATKLRVYRSFEMARAFAREQRLRSRDEWTAFTRSANFPDDIPSNPDNAYRHDGWAGFGDWLGTGNIAPRLKTYRSFIEARRFAHKLKLRSWDEWRAFCQSGQLPSDIPATPNRSYQEKGWISIGDWLGTQSIANSERIYVDFVEARRFVRNLRLTSGTAWRAYCKSGNKPVDIPATPERIYRDSGWIDMSDWLGVEIVATFHRVYRPFAEARSFVRSRGLRNEADWRRYCRSGEKPSDIPSSPAEVYATKGWCGLGDWLGTGNIATFRQVHRPFEEAREFIRALRIKSVAEWYEYLKGGHKPADIPANPQRTYRGKGWSGMGDWLGTGAIATFKREYRDFENARTYARSLNLRTAQGWQQFARGGNRPTDIPSSPERTYRDSGWQGWRDWLGTKPRK